MTAPAEAKTTESALHAMVRATPTDYWNDSCGAADLAYAVARGATGATSNPSIVLEVLRQRAGPLAAADPRDRGRRIRTGPRPTSPGRSSRRWRCAGAAVLEPVFRLEGGRKGRLSLQTNPANYPNAERMLEQGHAVRRHWPRTCRSSSRRRGPGSRRSRRRPRPASTSTRPSASRSRRRSPWPRPWSAASTRSPLRGGDAASMSPVCTIMIGRLDDWMRVLVERDGIPVHPDALDWAGIATFKRAYALFRERGYRTRLLAAAFRHRLHWTELVGARRDPDHPARPGRSGSTAAASVPSRASTSRSIRRSSPSCASGSRTSRGPTIRTG